MSWEDVRRRRHEEEEDFPRQAAKIPRYRSKNTVWTVKNKQIIDINLICQGGIKCISGLVMNEKGTFTKRIMQKIVPNRGAIQQWQQSL